ncbi:urease accessory protein UreF [Thalassobacillus devorans]|uniref:urease accessory protein UreF n=1 Tax=Thalassobacillus devorans TaxID=279813 RepID=UPI00048E36BE|nr:urease accessory protein UreF [Thalassobacillus devorans]
MDRQFLNLMQLCDSNFPTGAFSHSFGLETYIQDDAVFDKNSFSSWLEAYLEEQLLYTEGITSSLVYEALKRDDLETIWELDSLITVQSLPSETRDANMKMGDRFLKTTIPLYDFPILYTYREKIRNKEVYGHPAIVFTMIAYGLNVPKETTVISFLYASISNLVQNAVRGIPIGQSDGQQILHDFQNHLIGAVRKIEELSIDDFGITAPGLEVAQMNHEHLNIRIFMS